MKIIACYDNGGETLDRYTIVFNTFHDYKKTLRECLALSKGDEDGFFGFSQFSSCQLGKHLGKKLKFEQLPEHVQKHIKSRME
jgi:hypothetical protein